MRFRFTISRTAQAIDPFPDIDDWLSSALGYPLEVPWQDVGTANPFVAFLDSDIKTSEYLYTEYDFVAGLEYTITLEINRTEDAITPLNPRTLTLVVFDDFNDIEFSESYAASPGTASYNITFTATATCTKFGIRFTSGSARTITVLSLTPDLPESSTASYEINEPDGWKDCTLKLTRDPIFHSLVEHFDGSFIFYGDNGQVNGGYEILKAWDEDGGPDVDINLLIEYTEDDTEFNEIFTGQLDMSIAVWMLDNKVRIPIIKDAFWANFFNRKEIPVDLKSTKDLDDNDVLSMVDDIDIDLPSQKVRYYGDYNWLDSFTYAFDAYNTEFAMQVDWDETVIDDVKKFTLPRAMVLDPGNDGVNTGESIVGIFEAPWDGDYVIDIIFPFAFYDDDDEEWRNVSSVNFWMHGVSDLPTSADRFVRTTDSNGDDSWNIFSMQRTIRASKGQQFKVYGTFAGPVTAGDLPRYTIFGERRLVWRTANLATTGTITLFGEQTIDGVMTSSSVVLVRNQGDASLNGLYTSNAAAWTRHASMDTASEFIDAAVYVTSGDDNAGSAWRQSETEIDLGSSAITWVYMLPNDERLRPFPEAVDNHFKITADTTFRKTRATGFLIHDAAAAVIDRYGLGFETPFYSEVFGSDRTQSRQYDDNGCYWKYGLTRGLQLRGYNLSEKPFSVSFMDWWNGADPIFNLGLGYEYVPESVVIPEQTVVQDLDSWTNAGGPNPGTWTFTSPDIPHTSANGSGGVTGYAQGTCVTEAGETYEFSFTLEIFDTGSSGEITEVTVAILDGSGNELDTEVFNYTDAGVKTESFFLTPVSDGSFVAIRLTNNTPFDTKSYELTDFHSEDEVVPIVTPAEKRIRVEKRSFFYDPDPVVYLSNIRKVERKYDNERIFQKITIGFQQWKTEDISGIDDPQTKHTYASRLKKTGEEVEVLSEYIGASLAIEQARRQSIDRTTDYQYDDNTFIIALAEQQDETSPDLFLPETSENFTTINNLLNGDTRYNLRITPARNFLRHLNWFNIGLQSYVGSIYRFVKGEGNYDVETAMLESCPEEDYDGELLSEKVSLFVTDDALHSPYFYDIEYPMSRTTYAAINANRNNAIAVSQTDGGHIPFFIQDLSYKLTRGTATISGWTKEYWDIKKITGTVPTQDCLTTEITDEDNLYVEYDDNSPVFYDDETFVLYE